MKRTGRVLTLKGRVEDNAIDTIIGSGYELTTIFNDDRQGYGWKITGIEQWNFPPSASGYAGSQQSYALMSAAPNDFTDAIAFGLTIVNMAENMNSFVASSYINRDGFVSNVIDSNHVIVNQLSLLYAAGGYPGYIVYLEEYQISDNEEITFRIKEKSQDFDKVE